MKRKDVPAHILAAFTTAQGELAAARLLAMRGTKPTPEAMRMAKASLASYGEDYLRRARAVVAQLEAMECGRVKLPRRT